LKNAVQGVWGLCHQQAKTEISAQTEILGFSHLWTQVHCLPEMIPLRDVDGKNAVCGYKCPACQERT
jgi:hypothetical protein